VRPEPGEGKWSLGAIPIWRCCRPALHLRACPKRPAVSWILASSLMVVMVEHRGRNRGHDIHHSRALQRQVRFNSQRRCQPGGSFGSRSLLHSCSISAPIICSCSLADAIPEVCRLPKFYPRLACRTMQLFCRRAQFSSMLVAQRGRHDHWRADLSCDLDLHRRGTAGRSNSPLIQ